jgi:Protein of unknown function (DUF3604).
MKIKTILAMSSAFVLVACQQASTTQAPERGQQVERVANASSSFKGERQLFWGDTHLHTRNSADAYEDGNNNADLETAYRFARGFPVIHPRSGERITMDRPLDFLVVADHAEMLGVLPRLADGDPALLATRGGKELYDLQRQDPLGAYRATMKLGPNAPVNQIIKDLNAPEIRRTLWAEQVDAAERHNRPGVFTALIGWEWSSTPNGVNQHRVVFTPAGGEVAKQFLPLSNYDTMRPEDLWKYLRETRARTGADFVAIPHNSNLSQGQMFNLADTEGNPLDAAYARERMEWERVVEVTQYKGTSETHPALSKTDEFAGFEIRETMFGTEPVKILDGSYARKGLLAGLEAQARTGVNPFAFGLIGSSDSHSGFSAQAESEFYGKSGADHYPPERAADKMGPMNAWKASAGGIAAVWADRNDRQSIYEAFRRREVYGTSGPRITLRFFGGFHFRAADSEAHNLAELGYRKGVPMGGELLRSRSAQAPRFLIQAVKDPLGANLDRVQVIKGWRDAQGKLREKIFNVAWSGRRQIAADGSLPPVGNSVDVRTARYSNDIGDLELVTVWSDPEFSPDLPAFYYVRVLEIPTPRHHLFDALALGLDPSKIDQPLTIQERAWSSPIWYRP